MNLLALQHKAGGRSQPPSPVLQLVAFHLNEWYNIPLHSIQGLYGSAPKTTKAVLKANGCSECNYLPNLNSKAAQPCQRITELLVLNSSYSKCAEESCDRGHFIKRKSIFSLLSYYSRITLCSPHILEKPWKCFVYLN